MDPADTFLGRLLMEEITPVVMVLSTPLAEEACRKSGLDVVRLLAPFCVFNNIDVPVRTATDQPYRLQTFRVRMVYASEIRPWDPEVANKHLEDAVSKASENVKNDFQNDLPALQKMLAMAESEVVPSWLYSFNRDFSRALSFSDHETFDHPVACLLVVSSEDELPMNRFVDLFNTNQLPVHLSDSAMDPKIPKHYLLLHDGHVGTTEKALSVLAEMRGTFGLSDCRLLCINSLKGVAEEWRENPWVDYQNSSSSEDNACCLSIDDFNEIKTFMHDLSSKKIIPHLETKIRTLNQQVSATRKGFRNQIRNLWWRKGKEDAPETPDGPMYTFSSIESQIRILGDYAFMLRDYELALSNYRLLSTDYKLDKAWKRYAGVQEMVGLSLFMLDQSRKDSEYSMENAFNTYLRLGSLGLRNAARCGLWWAEMLKARAQYKEAAVVYFRMASEEPSLHSAVFLEQAAYCYLFSSPPMLRKFGFHLVLAGNRYYNADQRRHAIRTYRCALSVYKKNDWSYISDHVHYNIGRWYAYLGLFDAAILHMLEVLECTHQSLTTQDLFLKDFLHIVQNTGRKLEVPKLQLPSINMSSIRVIFEDYRTYASPAAVHVRESTWQALEENLIPSSATNKSNWLDNRKIHLPKKYDSCVSVVGEAIKVQLELKNPLQVSISVANVSLVCEYRSSHAADESDDSLSMDGIQNNILDPNISTPSDTNDHSSSFELSEINFLLGGGQTRDVQLSVIPKLEGFLKILGVKWTLSGSVMGYQSLDLDAKRKSRKGRGSVQPFRNMAFIVIKGLPKLKGFIRHLPQNAYKGDLRLLMLELKNDSEYSVKNLKMKFGQPRFLIPGSLEDMNTEFPRCLQKQSSSLRKNASEDCLEKSGSLLFVFPSDSRISAGMAFRWPLWLHAALPGKLSLCISIYYEVDNLTCDMNYRTLRIHHELEVSPSIDVSISITPCPNRLQEFLVQMEVASKTNSESFWLQQLSSVGCGWKILPLSLTDSVCSSQLLLAGQKLMCFFKLKGSGKFSLGDDERNCEQSDLRLGPQDDNDLLFDISRTPLADFHKQEKFQNGKSLQENPGMVNFVLFSHLVEDVAGPDDAECIRLLSHHVCHRSITSKSPIQWLIIGPQTVIHDFSVPFFEVDFCCQIHNCSDAVASVKIVTFDTSTPTSHSRDSPPLSDSFTSGWHEISFDTKPTSSDVSVSRHVRPSPESVTPFVWCASSSTKVEVQPVSVAEVPLRICVFSPGIYDLSNYEMHYSLQFLDAEGLVKDLGWQSSGMNRGHPYYLSVLESMQ